MADGHLNFCKACVKSRVSTHREANLERIHQYDRERSKEPKRKAHLTRNFKKMVERYPEKRIARSAVSNAIRDGRLFKQPCQVCSSSKSEAHHLDYSKPLEVIWLCKLHHEEAHKS
jgi:hypothetical protein